MSRTQAGSRSAFRWFCETSTQWRDVDIYGHVNNTVHYAWFDTAVNRWLIGQGLLDPKRSEVIGLVVNTRCDYFAEAYFLDRITCGVAVERVGRTSITYSIGLFRNDDSTAFAQGSLVHVYVDAKTHRPVPLAPQMIDAVGEISSPETATVKSTEQI